MKLAVGTPPVDQFAILDTGSDLIWIQCQPCTDCYQQDSPFFDPSQSSTYSQNVPCTSNACLALPSSKCDGTNNQCLYDYHYGDKSYTKGELATDTFTFDGESDTEFPGTFFGCGHINGGLFNSHGSGLVGLGRGDLSLNSQLSNTIHNKFSYCLVPPNSGLNSKLKFAEDADTASAANAVSTPMLSHDGNNYYYLNLEAVTVGGNTIQNQVSGGGNIIIDSGTTLNMLNPGLYSDLEAAVRAMVGLNPVQHPTQTSHLCYEAESLIKVPGIQMTFHFTGADVILNTINIFKNGGYGLDCFSMIPTKEDGIDIYGNRAQINFQIEHDLGSNKISFAPADCTQF
ncbi:Aspartic proteinase nepenthesin-1 [Heracleum sosnowskyi]|uniref:Aspartic proteinase nepenthesin-1 n=1 Tax=Heracleum sosnowskyi TaxID=360622 RepID=A0AAD8HZP9_9APIA|nr:Aspartic proteinase nepenthesin-1 [Heracleum sosnowskyi]